MYGDPYNIEIEAMGGEVKFPEDSIPHLGEPLLRDSERAWQALHSRSLKAAAACQ